MQIILNAKILDRSFSKLHDHNLESLFLMIKFCSQTILLFFCPGLFLCEIISITLAISKIIDWLNHEEVPLVHSMQPNKTNTDQKVLILPNEMYVLTRFLLNDPNEWINILLKLLSFMDHYILTYEQNSLPSPDCYLLRSN